MYEILSHHTDVAIFVTFLIINLVVGIRVGREIRNFYTYVLGKHHVSVATLSATIVATWVSGGTLAHVLAQTYTGGIQAVIVIMGGVLNLLFVGQVIVMRM